MDTAETTLTFDDCASELKRIVEIRRAHLLECVESNGPNRTSRQRAHVMLAKLTGASEIIEELRQSDSVNARICKRVRTIKTTL